MSSGHDGLHGDWAYVGIVSVLPIRSLDVRVALLIQFLLFEGGAIVLALWFDRPRVLPAATAAIVVTTAGSGLMLTLSEWIRRLNSPARYRQLLFGSSLDVLLGVVAFLLLVTSLLMDASGQQTGILERLLGERPPAPMVFFALVVLWDLCYRIGTGWWASLTGLWRSITFRMDIGEDARAGYHRADLLTMVFAGFQLLLVPFLWSDRLLVLALLGHVLAVFVVSTAAVLVLRRG